MPLPLSLGHWLVHYMRRKCDSLQDQPPPHLTGLCKTCHRLQLTWALTPTSHWRAHFHSRGRVGRGRSTVPPPVMFWGLSPASSLLPAYCTSTSYPQLQIITTDSTPVQPEKETTIITTTFTTRISPDDDHWQYEGSKRTATISFLDVLSPLLWAPRLNASTTLTLTLSPLWRYLSMVLKKDGAMVVMNTNPIFHSANSGRCVCEADQWSL